MPFEIKKHYTKDDAAEIWIWNDGEPIDYRDGSEDYLEEVFAATGGASGYPVELGEYIKDWPSRYHFSHQRANLLEGIKDILDTKGVVLELGAGTGSITRWLADNFSHVDAIEGNLQRAKVNRLRTAGLSNVRLLVGDMVKAPWADNVDVVTQIGSLEYIPVYQDGDPRKVCVGFLDKVRQSLAPGGSYVLAIENRLGLKYWAGCGEDHTGGFADGLVGYPDRSPVTFSRIELESMLKESGFKSIQFYHLFPDYKLTSVLLRECDETLAVDPHHWFRGFAEDYTGERLFVLPDQVMLENLVKDKLLWHFSNSFLVVCSAEPDIKHETEWLIKKFSNGAKPELHHTITLAPKPGGGYRVNRQPIHAGEASVDLGKVSFALADADYIAGESLTSEAYLALLSRDWKVKITGLLRETADELLRRYHNGETDEEKYPLVDGASLDFAFWNLIRKVDGGIEFIDNKWTYNQSVPADYVLFRNLFWLFYQFGPFMQEKDIAMAVVELMRGVFPGYDATRQQANFKREDEFQSLVFDSPSSLESYVVDASNVRETIMSLRASVREKDELAATLLGETHNLQATLDDIYQSRSWKVVSAYSRFMDRILAVVRPGR